MKRSIHSLLTLTYLVGLSLGAVSTAQANGLGLDSALGLLSFGNFSASYGSDVQGQVAVGGNALINAYSINTITGTQATYGGTGLTVGGNLDFSNGAIWGNTIVGGNLSTGAGASFAGNVQVAGNLNFNNNSVAAATNGWATPSTITYAGSASNIVQSGGINPSPTQVAAGSIQTGINFAAEQQRLTSLSKSFDALTNSGTSYMDWGTLVLNANNASVAVFDLTASDVTHNMRLDNFGPNSTVIINVLGQSVDFTAGGYQNFNLASDLAVGHVLFNLPQATQVSFSSGVYASFLAPLAQFSTAGGGFIGGQVVVAGWSGSGQVNDNPFVSAVPEPETYAMLLAGLGLIGFTARRRKPVAAKA